MNCYCRIFYFRGKASNMALCRCYRVVSLGPHSRRLLCHSSNTCYRSRVICQLSILQDDGSDTIRRYIRLLSYSIHIYVTNQNVSEMLVKFVSCHDVKVAKLGPEYTSRDSLWFPLITVVSDNYIAVALLLCILL